jgi:PHD/YefM family antitoxin component YafN of YafNO toxin-antitoxin module
MKDITIEQFNANVNSVVSFVLQSGDIYRITTGKGNAVIMEEAEYKILHDAAELLIR